MTFLGKKRDDHEAEAETDADGFWADATQEHDAVFTSFAKSQSDDPATVEDIVAELEPLQKKAWQVAEKLIKHSYRNGRAQATARRRQREAS